MLKVLPASYGDCIIIRYGDNKENLNNIIVDGGVGFSCFKILKKFIKERTDQNHKINLIIITHVDDDHLIGIKKVIQDKNISKEIIQDVWFNSGKILAEFFKSENNGSFKEIPLDLSDVTDMSIAKGITLERHLEDLKIWSKTLIKSTADYEISDATIKIVSPNIEALRQLNENWEIETSTNTDMASTNDYDASIEDFHESQFTEDSSVPNKSSIGFILEYANKGILMLGDSHPSIVIESLLALGYSEKNKLKVDIVKLSHHGSKFNTSKELLSLIDCKNYIISTNGTQHGLPHKECLSRIIAHLGSNATFYFNYKISDGIFKSEEVERFGFNCNYLDGDEYIILED
jgi:ribonuclease BN (tRNA processing enzyme)